MIKERLALVGLALGSIALFLAVVFGVMFILIS